MTDKCKGYIEELKKIRLELFRAAASLDSTINNIETYVNDNTRDFNYTKMGVVLAIRCRGDEIKINEWENLSNQEKDVCAKLLSEFMNEKEG